MKAREISISHLNHNPVTASEKFEAILRNKHPDMHINRVNDHKFEIFHGDVMDKDDKSVVTSFTTSHFIKPASYSRAKLFLSKHLNEDVSTYYIKIKSLNEEKYLKVENALNEDVAKKYALLHAGQSGCVNAAIDSIHTK